MIYEFELIIEHYLLNNELKKAKTVSEYGIQLHPHSTLLKIKKVQSLIDLNKPIESLAILNKLCKIESGNSELFFLKGKALCLIDEINKAISNFNKAVNLSYDNKASLFCNIAYTFESIGEYKLAADFLLRAKTEDPLNYNILYDIAFYYDKINKL